MKKKYLNWAGIIAVAILAILFTGILITGTFTFFPTASINPAAPLDAGDLMVISGTTNLPAGGELVLDILPASGSDAGNGVGTDAIIERGSGMTNTWSAAVDTTSLAPGEYLINVTTLIINATDGTITTGNLLATSRFTLGTPAGGPAGAVNPRVNRTPFIAVNPIGTKRIGDRFLVTGTTNLPVDTDLLYAVIQQDNTSTFSLDPKTREMTTKGGATVTGLIAVFPGTEGVNRLSFGVDTTQLIPGPYIVNVSTIQGNISEGNISPGELSGSTGFTLEDSQAAIPAPGTGANRTPFITVDTPGVQPFFGERLTLTGTTNLPAGDGIMVQVTPSFTSDYSVIVDPRTGAEGGFFSGIMGGTEVVRGAGNVNLWSLTIETASLRPSTYEVNASTYTQDPATKKVLFGNVSGTAQFTLRG